MDDGDPALRGTRSLATFELAASSADQSVVQIWFSVHHRVRNISENPQSTLGSSLVEIALPSGVTMALKVVAIRFGASCGCLA